jgi:hypothetical protein
LTEQLAECELWCFQRSEKEYVPIAEKGLRVLPVHHAELARPLLGQEPRANGWVLRGDALGLGSLFLFVMLLLTGFGMCFLISFRLVERTDHPISSRRFCPWSRLRRWSIFRSACCCGATRSFSATKPWSSDDMSCGDLTRNGACRSAKRCASASLIRGVHARRRSPHGGSHAQLSVVVSSGEAEIVFGNDLEHAARARLAILIDHHYNGVTEIPREV